MWSVGFFWAGFDLYSIIPHSQHLSVAIVLQSPWQNPTHHISGKSVPKKTGLVSCELYWTLNIKTCQPHKDANFPTLVTHQWLRYDKSYLPTRRKGRGPYLSIRIPSGRVVALSRKEPMVKPRLSISSWSTQLSQTSSSPSELFLRGTMMESFSVGTSRKKKQDYYKMNC